MKNIYELVKNEFSFGNQTMYYYQERAKRIAAAAAYIAQKVFITRPLRMSALDFYNTALICQIADKEKPELYINKKEYGLDDIKRGAYSICKARFELGIDISGVQMEVIGKKESIERDIIELAEAFVASPSLGKNEEVEEAFNKIFKMLLENPRVNSELLQDGQVEKALRYLYQFEDVNKTQWEMMIFVMGQC